MAQSPNNSTSTGAGGFADQARGTRNRLFNFSSAVLPIAQLIPGPVGTAIRDIIQSPTGAQFFRQAAGQEASAALEEARPELTGPSTTGSQFSFTGPGGEDFDVSLPEIGRRAVGERTETFNALTEQAEEQRAETDRFRTTLAESVREGRRLDALLRQSTAQGAQEYNAAIQEAGMLRFESRALLQTAFRTASDMIQEVKRDQGRVRDDFDADIAERAAATADGVRANSRQSFDTHVRAIESASGPLSPDERASIRSMYDRDAGRQIAMAVGSLHEAAADRKAAVDTQLSTNLTSLASTIISNTTSAITTSMSLNQAATELRGKLAEGKANHLRTMATARVELSEFTQSLALDGASQLFEMVTTTTRPVAVFSDILFNMFDAAWSVQAFENDLELQRFQVEAAIRNPLDAAFVDSIGMIERNRMIDAQRHTASEANSTANLGAIYGAIGNVAGSFAGKK